MCVGSLQFFFLGTFFAKDVGRQFNWQLILLMQLQKRVQPQSDDVHSDMTSVPFRGRGWKYESCKLEVMESNAICLKV